MNAPLHPTLREQAEQLYFILVKRETNNELRKSEYKNKFVVLLEDQQTKRTTPSPLEIQNLVNSLFKHHLDEAALCVPPEDLKDELAPNRIPSEGIICGIE